MAPDHESEATRDRPDDEPGTGSDAPPAEPAEPAPGETPDMTGDADEAEAPLEMPPQADGTTYEESGRDAERVPAETPDAEVLAEEVTALREELAAADARLADAEKRAQENLERARRTLADFENFRKRTRTQAEEAREKAKADVLRELVQVLDNFDRALEHSGDEESLYDGLKLIYRQLRSSLEAQGLRRVDAEGHAFDPQLHEAVMREPTSAYKEGVVIKEFEKGWFLGSKLLRPAKVKVAVAPPPDAPDEGASSPDEAEDA